MDRRDHQHSLMRCASVGGKVGMKDSVCYSSSSSRPIDLIEQCHFQPFEKNNGRNAQKKMKMSTQSFLGSNSTRCFSKQAKYCREFSSEVLLRICEDRNIMTAHVLWMEFLIRRVEESTHTTSSPIENFPCENFAASTGTSKAPNGSTHANPFKQCCQLTLLVTASRVYVGLH